MREWCSERVVWSSRVLFKSMAPGNYALKKMDFPDQGRVGLKDLVHKISYRVVMAEMWLR